jgi:hypothetical protein
MPARRDVFLDIDASSFTKEESDDNARFWATGSDPISHSAHIDEPQMLPAAPLIIQPHIVNPLPLSTTDPLSVYSTEALNARHTYDFPTSTYAPSFSREDELSHYATLAALQLHRVKKTLKAFPAVHVPPDVYESLFPPPHTEKIFTIRGHLQIPESTSTNFILAQAILDEILWYFDFPVPPFALPKPSFADTGFYLTSPYRSFRIISNRVWSQTPIVSAPRNVLASFVYQHHYASDLDYLPTYNDPFCNHVTIFNGSSAQEYERVRIFHRALLSSPHLNPLVQTYDVAALFPIAQRVLGCSPRVPYVAGLKDALKGFPSILQSCIEEYAPHPQGAFASRISACVTSITNAADKGAKAFETITECLDGIRSSLEELCDYVFTNASIFLNRISPTAAAGLDAFREIASTLYSKSRSLFICLILYMFSRTILIHVSPLLANLFCFLVVGFVVKTAVVPACMALDDFLCMLFDVATDAIPPPESVPQADEATIASAVATAMDLPLSILSSRKWMELNCVFTTARSLKSLVIYLAQLLPLALQDSLIHRYPHLADMFLLSTHGWNPIYVRMRACHETWKKEVTQESLSEARSVLKTAENFVTAHPDLPFQARISSLVSDFKLAINTRYAQLSGKQGMKPFVTCLFGQSRGGKSKLLEVLASVADVFYNQSSQPGERVYKCSAGAFLFESITQSQNIITVDEFMSHDTDSNSAHAKLLMSLGTSAEIRPDFARVTGEMQKGSSIICRSAFLATNRPFPTNTDAPLATNLPALYNRRDMLVYVTLDPTFHLYPRKPQGMSVKQIVESYIPLLTPEESAHFSFLRFKCVNPTFAPAIAPDDTSYFDTAPAVHSKAQPWIKFHDLIDEWMLTATRLHQHGLTMHDNQVTHLSSIMDLARSRGGALAPPSSLPPAYGEEYDKCFDVVDAVAKLTLATGAAFLLWKVASGIFGLFAPKVRTEHIDEAQYGTRDRTRRPRPKEVPAPISDPQLNPDELALDQRLQKSLLTITTTQGSQKANFIDACTILTSRHVFLTPDSHLVDEGSPLCFIGHDDVPREDSFSSSRLTQFPNGDGTYKDYVFYRLHHQMDGVRRLRGFFSESRNAPVIGSSIERVEPTLIVASKVSETFTSMDYPKHPRCATVRNAECFTIPASAQKGDCGLLYLSNSTGMWQIVGIHVGAAASRSVCAIVPRSDIPPSTDIYKQDPSEDLFLQPHIDVAQFSAARECPQGDYSVPSYRLKRRVPSNMRTSLRRTLYHNHFPSWPCRVTPAIMSQEALLRREARFLKRQRPLPDASLRFAVEWVSATLNIPSSAPRRPYTLDEATIPLDMSKAAGFPHCLTTNRRALFTDHTETLPNGELLTHHTPVPELTLRVESLLSLLRQGTVPPCVIVPSLKDECLAHAKALEKPRTFEILPIEWIIVQRILWGSFHDHITETCRRTPIAIGTVIKSPDFHSIISYLGEVSADDSFIELDYSAFETLVTPEKVDATCDVADRFYGDAGTPNALARRLTFHAGINCIVASGNASWKKLWGMPSGTAQTAPENSVVNLLIFASLVHLLAEDVHPADLHRLLRLKVYGDDLLGKAGAELRDILTYDRLSRCAANFDITLTRGDKQPITAQQGDSQLSSCAFLKAKFRYHPEFRLFVPFIHPHTLMDQLSFSRDPSIESVPPTAPGLCQSINSALSFAFFWGERHPHYDDAPSFEEFRNQLLGCIPADKHLYVQSYDDFSRAFNHQPVPALALPRAAHPDSKHGYMEPQMDEATFLAEEFAYHAQIVSGPTSEYSYLSSIEMNPLAVLIAATPNGILDAFMFLITYHRNELAHVVTLARDELDAEPFPHYRSMLPLPKTTIEDRCMAGFLGFTFYKRLIRKHNAAAFMALFPADYITLALANQQSGGLEFPTIKNQFYTDVSSPSGFLLNVCRVPRDIALSNYKATTRLLKKVEPQAVRLAQSTFVRFLLSPWRVKDPAWKKKTGPDTTNVAALLPPGPEDLPSPAGPLNTELDSVQV